MRAADGFTLIEMIVSMVLLGIVFTVAALFFSTMVRGYAESSLAASTAQAAEIATDRMVEELKDASGTITAQNAGGGSTTTGATTVTYTSSDPLLTGNRGIVYSGGDLYIRVDGTDHLLLEDLASFGVDLVEADIDGNAADNEISRFDISMTMQGYGGTFNARITPRNFISR